MKSHTTEDVGTKMASYFIISMPRYQAFQKCNVNGVAYECVYDFLHYSPKVLMGIGHHGLYLLLLSLHLSCDHTVTGHGESYVWNISMVTMLST